MTQIVEVPGHGPVEFPDNMSDEQIAAAIKKNLMVPKNAPSIGQRIVKGMKDPVDASAQLLTHVLPQSVVDLGNRANNWLASKTGLMTPIPERNLSGLVTGKQGGLDQLLSEEEQQYQASRGPNAGMDWARIGGNIASPMNLAIASKLPVAANLLPRIGIGAAGGAVMGATGTPVMQGSFWPEKAKQAAFGAASGAATTAAAAGLARMIKPKTPADVQLLLDEGVTPTAGQIIGGHTQVLEDKATSMPVFGDAIENARTKSLNEFNKAAYNRALEPIGGKVPQDVGREGIQSVREQISDVYEQLLPKLTFKADKQFSNDLMQLQSMASGLPQEQAGRFMKILKNQIVGKMGPRGTMDGETLKGVESELSRLASGYKADSSFDNRELGSAIEQMQALFKQALVRNNPQFADELKAANTAWANYTRLRGAAAAQGAVEGKFTPSQLSASVKAQDKTLGKRAFSEGTALMQDLSDAGKNVLTSKYPESGTPGRLMLMSLMNPYAWPKLAAGLAVGSVGSLPYLPGGRQITAALLARRPELAGPLADAVRNNAMYLAPGVTSLLESNP